MWSQMKSIVSAESDSRTILPIPIFRHSVWPYAEPQYLWTNLENFFGFTVIKLWQSVL
jgi:hypothetical protein